MPKPVCKDADSQPRVFVVPAAFLSPNGASIVGVRAYAENGRGAWTIRMEAAVNEDKIGDGKADVIALDSGSDYALVLAKCS